MVVVVMSSSSNIIIIIIIIIMSVALLYSLLGDTFSWLPCTGTLPPLLSTYVVGMPTNN